MLFVTKINPYMFQLEITQFQTSPYFDLEISHYFNSKWSTNIKPPHVDMVIYMASYCVLVTHCWILYC